MGLPFDCHRLWPNRHAKLRRVRGANFSRGSCKKKWPKYHAALAETHFTTFMPAGMLSSRTKLCTAEDDSNSTSTCATEDAVQRRLFMTMLVMNDWNLGVCSP